MSTKTPSPLLIVAPEPSGSVTAALKFANTIRVCVGVWSNRKSALTVWPPSVSVAPSTLTVTVGPAGRSSTSGVVPTVTTSLTAAAVVLIATLIAPPLRLTLLGSENVKLGDVERAGDAALAENEGAGRRP